MTRMFISLISISMFVCSCLCLPGCMPKAKPVINLFSANPATITPGGSTTLSWKVNGAKSVSLNNSIGYVASSGTRGIAPETTTEYVLTATNASGKVTATTMVVVSGAGATTSSGQNTGQSSGTNTGASLTGGSSRSIDSSINTNINTNMDIHASAGSGSGGSSSVPDFTSDDPPRIRSMTASPDIISMGESTYIKWEVDGATSVTILPDIGNRYNSGGIRMYPNKTTDYVLTATNAGGSNQTSVRVTVKSSSATLSGLIQQIPPAVILYDFIARAQTADWINNDKYLEFPGSNSDRDGFALIVNNATLEDDKAYSKVLEMHPKWVTGGFLWGNYTELAEHDTYTPKSGDHFRANAGFLKGATAGNVTFRVLIRCQGQPTYTAEEISKTYNGSLTSIDVPLAGYAGKKISIDLFVKANNTDAKQAWAVWVNPRIER